MNRITFPYNFKGGGGGGGVGGGEGEGEGGGQGRAGGGRWALLELTGALLSLLQPVTNTDTNQNFTRRI